MKTAVRLVIALALVAFLATPAMAKVYKGITVGEMEQMMKTLGFQYEIKTDSAGDPMLAFKQAQLRVGLYFYHKVGGQYTAIQLSTGFSMSNGPSLEKINEWNRTKRYARAYLDKEGDPRVEVDLDLEGGVTEGAIKELFRTNSAVLAQFTKHIGWK
jgi:hypothetical protein